MTTEENPTKVDTKPEFIKSLFKKIKENREFAEEQDRETLFSFLVVAFGTPDLALRFLNLKMNLKLLDNNTNEKSFEDNFNAMFASGILIKKAIFLTLIHENVSNGLLAENSPYKEWIKNKLLPEIDINDNSSSLKKLYPHLHALYIPDILYQRILQLLSEYQTSTVIAFPRHMGDLLSYGLDLNSTQNFINRYLKAINFDSSVEFEGVTRALLLYAIKHKKFDFIYSVLKNVRRGEMLVSEIQSFVEESGREMTLRKVETTTNSDPHSKTKLNHLEFTNLYNKLMSFFMRLSTNKQLEVISFLKNLNLNDTEKLGSLTNNNSSNEIFFYYAITALNRHSHLLTALNDMIHNFTFTDAEKNELSELVTNFFKN